MRSEKTSRLRRSLVVSGIRNRYELMASRAVYITIFVVLAACSPRIFEESKDNESLMAFERHVDQCKATLCQTDFPSNQSCQKARMMLTQGEPKIAGQQQSIHYYQLRLLYSNAYADWLEGEAGKSIMGRSFCGRELEYLDNPINSENKVDQSSSAASSNNVKLD